MIDQIKSFLSTYLVNLLLVVGSVLLVAFSVQSVRIHFFKGDILVLESKLQEAAVINAQNQTTLKSLKDAEIALQGRLDKAQTEIVDSERRHSDRIKKILSEIPIPVSGKCDDMITWAKQMALRGDK